MGGAQWRLGGLWGNTSGGFYGGAMDDLRIYDRVLSRDEIIQFTGVPASPVRLNATGGDGRIILNWEKSSRTRSYHIFRSELEGTGYVSLAAGITRLEYVDFQVNDRNYYYVVRAVNPAGESESSNQATAIPVSDREPPQPNPMGWEVRPFSPDSRTAAMTARPAGDVSGVEYYFACTSGGGHDSGWQSNPYYEDSGLTPDRRYTYTVRARDRSSQQNQTLTSIPVSVLTASGAAVTNPGFEADSAAGNGLTPAGWTWNGKGGHGLATGGTEGGFFYWQGNGSRLYQTTGRMISRSGMKYQLNADVRNSWRGAPGLALYYLDGDQRIELGSRTLPAAGDSWPVFAPLELIVLTTADSVGKPLGVELMPSNSGWAEYDRIQLIVLQETGWLFGDFNGDHQVNMIDWRQFSGLWIINDCVNLSDFDIDEDCRIGLIEFHELMRNWLASD